MKKKVIITVSAILLLSVASVFLYRRVNQKDIENISVPPDSDTVTTDSVNVSNNKEYDYGFPIIKKMNEPLVIKSRMYEQGDQRVEDYGMNMGWNGDLEITVTSAKVYDSPEDAGVSASELPSEEESYLSTVDNPKFILIDTTINNISAEYLFGIKYEFNAAMFRLLLSENFSQENYNNIDYRSVADDSSNVNKKLYFSHHTKDEVKYCHFNLPKGEKIDTQLGFFVNDDIIKNNRFVLKVGECSENELGIELDKLDKGE
jgi:hypothetical protein